MAELALRGRPSIPATNDCSFDFSPDNVDQEVIFRAADYRHAPFPSVDKPKSYEAWPSDVFQSLQHPVDVVLENFECHQEWERRFTKNRDNEGCLTLSNSSNTPSRVRCFTAQAPTSPPRSCSPDRLVDKYHPRTIQSTRKMKLMLHSNGYGRTFLVDTPKAKVTRGVPPRLPPSSRTSTAFLCFGRSNSPSRHPSSEPYRSKSTIPTVSYSRAFKSPTPAPAKAKPTPKRTADVPPPPFSPPLRPWSERKAESNDVLDKILGRFDITMDCIVESFGGTSANEG